MAAKTDELGLYQHIYRTTFTADICGCLQEVIGDRKHGAQKKTAFLLAYFEHRGNKYFVIASDQPRSLESINRELTPFASHSMKGVEEAELATTGLGGNFLMFRLGGTFSMLFSATSGEFTTEYSAWNLIKPIDTFELIDKIKNDDTTLNLDHYRPIPKTPLQKAHDYTPFFCEEEFMNTALFKHIQEKAYKHFYIFREPDVERNPDLRSKSEFDSLCTRLSNIYELPLTRPATAATVTATTSTQGSGGLSNLIQVVQRLSTKEEGDLEIYTAYGSNSPIIPLTPGNKLLLHPSHAQFTVRLEWMLGDRVCTDENRVWFRNSFRFIWPSGEVFYGTMEPNGQDKTDKNGKNRWNLKMIRNVKMAAEPSRFRPDFALSFIRLKKSSIEHLKETERASLGSGVYIRVEGELLNDRPLYNDRNIRNLEGGESRWRIILDVLTKKAKTDETSGLMMSAYKPITSIKDELSISQSIRRTVLLCERFKKLSAEHLESERIYEIDEFKNCLKNALDDRERAKNQKDQTKSRNGIKFEIQIHEGLTKTNPQVIWGTKQIPMSWMGNDKQISVTHDLTGEAIDILGSGDLGDGRKLFVAIQAKNKKTITAEEREKFYKSVEELRNKYGESVCIPMLVQKEVKSFSSILQNECVEKGVWLLSGEKEDIKEAASILCQRIGLLVKAVGPRA